MIDLQALVTALLAAAIIGAMPLALASVGEAIGETAGLLNLGIEGNLLIGSLTGFWVAAESGSLTLGLAAGGLAGLCIGGVFGLLSAVVGADQVVLGLGLTLFGIGITGHVFRETYGSSQPLLAGSMGTPFADWAHLVPVVGRAMLGQPWFVYVSFLVILVVERVLRASSLGLRIRAVGESPVAADASGIDVAVTRTIAAILSGGMVGLAGASLSVVELGFFQPGVTVGTGFIAIALAMVSNLRPWRIVIFALAFGALRGLGTGLQIVDVSVSPELLQLLPYTGVVVALVVLRRHGRLPSSLGQSIVAR